MTTSLRLTALYRLLFIAVALLLLNAALRLPQLVDFAEYPDEIFMLWHTQGSLEEAIRREPFDWPPAFTILTWVWTQLTGPWLETARVLPVLLSGLTLVCLVQAAQAWLRVFGWRIRQPLAFAWLAALIFLGVQYIIFIGVDMRAYGLLMLWGAAALWALLRWLLRPIRGRAAALILCLAALLYTSYTALPYLGLLALIALAARPALWWRGLLIGVGVGVAVLPLVQPFLAAGFFARSRIIISERGTLPQELYDLFFEFSGSFLWVALLGVGVIALVSLLLRWPDYRRGGLLLLLWVAAPVAVYLAGSESFLYARYLWWLMLGTALLLAVVVCLLPRWVLPLALVVAFALAIAPKEYWRYRFTPVFVVPFRENLARLAQTMRPGDVVVQDPGCLQNVHPMGWDYFVPLYFPAGSLPFVTDPGDAERVWYIYCGFVDVALAEKVAGNGRQASTFWGPWHFVFRLYERPPDLTGAAFGTSIRLHGVALAEPRYALREGEAVAVRLWWSASTPPPADYSFSLALLDPAGGIIAQADGAVQPLDSDQPLPTSAWEPGRIYEEVRTLQLPYRESLTGVYPLVVIVYQWWDGVRLSPAAHPRWEALPGDLLRVDSLYLWSW